MMCQEKNINRAKLTKGKFKAFLTIRYKGVIAERIKASMGSFFSVPMDYEFFCDVFDKFLNPPHLERVLKLVYSIYDFNEDRLIDELDAYCFYCHYEQDSPEQFMSLFYDDWMLIVSRIQKKKRDRGYQNRDIDVKIKKIEMKLNLIKKAARQATFQT